MKDFLTQFLNEDSHIKVQTSGSTGEPKLLEVQKSKMRHSALKTCQFLGLKKGDTALLCLPLQYISGQMMVVRAMVADLNLKLTQPSLYPLKEFHQTFDFCAMTPLQVENSLDQLHLIKKLIIGGAAISIGLKNKMFEALKSKTADTIIYETYGMSETLSHIALKQIYPISEDFFTAFDGVNLSTDARNCLVIDAPEWCENPLITNDWVEMGLENQFRVLGRLDFVINSGGVKIHPELLENQLKFNLNKELIFCGMPDEYLGEKLVLVIESDENEIDKELIKSQDWENKIHQPKKVYFLKELARTPNGKLDRKAIVEQLISIENERF